MGRGDKGTSVEVNKKKRSAGASLSEDVTGTPEEPARGPDQPTDTSGDLSRLAGELRGTADDENMEPDPSGADAPDTEAGAAFLTRLETDYRNQADLPAAFELIAEACAAVKIAEDRVQIAEEALDEANSYYSGQIENLTQRLDVADRRAEAAEQQAARAEERLRIFCQSILTTMHKT